MPAFDFQRMDVYRAAIEFIAVGNAIIERLPRGNGYLVDQLQRASTSIALNIAEGAGEAQTPEKARFYRMARRSAFECAAVLDVLANNRLADPTELRTGMELLQRIGAMLTRLAEPGRYSGSGQVREQPTEQSDSDSDASRLDSDSVHRRRDAASDDDLDADAPALD